MTSRIRYTFALLNSKGVEFCMSGRSALLRISGELSVPFSKTNVCES